MTEVTSTPTRPVDNVVITTKGLQGRKKLLLDGSTVENKGKLILTFKLTNFSNFIGLIVCSLASLLKVRFGVLNNYFLNSYLPNFLTANFFRQYNREWILVF